LTLTAQAQASPPRARILKAGDGFTLANSRIGCLAGKRPDHGYSYDTLICFKQTGSFTYRPAPGTNVLIDDEIGLGVEHLDVHGHPTPVFAERQPPAAGAPLGLGRATPLIGKVALLHPGDSVYLTGTHIVCVDINRTPTLACGSTGARGLTQGSYFATLTDEVAVIDRVRSPPPFQRVFQAKQ
jgi:hypothetical protein